MWPIQSDSGSNWGGGGGGDVLWLCGETQQIFNDTVQHGYKAGGVRLYEPPQDHLYYWLKYLLARWEPNGEDWPRDSIFLQTLKGRDAGKDSERRAPGAQGQPGDTTEVDQSGEGRDVSPPTRPPAHPQTTSLCHLYVREAAPRLYRASSCLYFLNPSRPLCCEREISDPAQSRAARSPSSSSAGFKVHNMRRDLCTGSSRTYWDLLRDFYSQHKSIPPLYAALGPSSRMSYCPWKRVNSR